MPHHQLSNMNTDVITMMAYKPPNIGTVQVREVVMMQSINSLMVLPPDLEHIQSCSLQVQNYDNIGIDPNGRWNKIVCTYAYFVSK